MKSKSRKKQLIASVVSLFSFITLSAYANISQNPFILVTPNCLLKNSIIEYQSLSHSDEFTLIKTNKAGLYQLIEAKSHHKSACGGFMNVTDAWLKNTKNQNAFLAEYTQPKVAALSTPSSNYSIRYTKQVTPLLNFNPQNMWTDLTAFSGNFADRYANSNGGINAANWLQQQLATMTTGRTDVRVYTVATGSYSQPSVVLKIGTSSLPAVVLGGHIDTLQRTNRKRMAGADDDGTGTVTLLETARVLLSSNMRFNKPIYIIWYSAEEVGLVGSQRVVAQFKQQNIPVDSVIQFDMTGYAPRNDLTMWLMTDGKYTNQELNNFLTTLITTYIKRPVKYATCGYACSDHASWSQQGYKASLPSEASMAESNPYIHTPQDTMSLLSLTHMTDYEKLAIAFAVEIAEPIA